MSDNENQTSATDLESEQAAEQQDLSHKEMELAMLKNRARTMGINFSNNIGLDALKQKINEKLEPNTPSQTQPEQEPEFLTDPDNAPKARKLNLRQWVQQEQMKLVRLRITNLNPSKKDLPGEIFTISNEYLGNIKKYIPYGAVTEDGYHVPFCIYKQLKARKFLNVTTKKGAGGQGIVIQQQWVPEFALEVLTPLTPEEIAVLAAAQTASNRLKTE